MEDPSLIYTVLIAALGATGGFVTFAMENPRDKYKSSIVDVKENRVADVTNALGPIIADVNEFKREEDGESIEELTDEDEATVALAASLSPDDDLPEVREAIVDFYEPEETYERCRKCRDWTYSSFVISIILVLLPQLSRLLPLPKIVSVGMFVASGVGLIGGVGLFFYFQRLRTQLDKMTESADFSLE
jgi:hypothetical protein